jgi:phosphoserine phosphatase RsbU/P
MPAVTDSYIREQLEKRRERLTNAIASAPVADPALRFRELLAEVDSAIERMDTGTYGICEVCNDTVERDRLIEDPLARFCLDHLSTEERRTLEGDLELAATIQRGLLPSCRIRSHDWQIGYEYRPANLVSGDYCDIIEPARDADGLIFLVGDVSGKGVAAALLMSYLRAVFRSLSSAGRDIDNLLEAANRLFCESTMAGQFATLICGRAGDGGEVEIVSAGHCPALIISGQGIRQVGATGLPLGMFATSRYTVERTSLEPGDSLLIYTDGISEARDAKGDDYGVDGILRLAHEWRAHMPRELAASCLKEVQGFSSGAPQADDQTVMVVRRVR